MKYKNNSEKLLHKLLFFLKKNFEFINIWKFGNINIKIRLNSLNNIVYNILISSIYKTAFSSVHLCIIVFFFW